MIHHIVCFRFQKGTTAGQIAAAGDALLAMQRTIPDVRGVRWTTNLAPSADEFSHVLMVILDDMTAVDRYLQHPAHLQAVSRFLAPIREARLAIDIEV